MYMKKTDLLQALAQTHAKTRIRYSKILHANRMNNGPMMAIFTEFLIPDQRIRFFAGTICVSLKPL